MDQLTPKHTSLVNVYHDYTSDDQTDGGATENPAYMHHSNVYVPPDSDVHNGIHTSIINVTSQGDHVTSSVVECPEASQNVHVGSSTMECPGEFDTMALAEAAAAGGEALNDVTVTYSSAFENANDVIILPPLNRTSGNHTSTPLSTMVSTMASNGVNCESVQETSLELKRQSSNYDTDIEVLTNALSVKGCTIAAILDKPNDYIELAIFSCLLNIVTGIIALNFASK